MIILTGFQVKKVYPNIKFYPVFLPVLSHLGV